MTFDEYNTDDNFDKKDSTLQKLVEIGKTEGKTSDDIKNSLSPKWQTSSKLDKLQSYYDSYEVPAKEEKKEIIKPVEAPKTEKPKTSTSGLTKADADQLKRTDSIADNGEITENAKQETKEPDRWEETINRMRKQGEAFNTIDDKYIANLPTFMLKDYADGKFGEPGSSDAKTRLAYFLVNGLQSQLKNASNAAAIAAGKSPIYTDTQSDYDKIRSTNMYKGLENHWKKNQEDTNAAIELAKKQGYDEQDLQSNITKISSNARLQTRFNMMNEQQKAYVLEVMAHIGDRLSDMNTEEFINTLTGYAMSGDTIAPAEFAEILVGRTASQNADLIDKVGNKIGTALTGGNGEEPAEGGNGGNPLDSQFKSPYGATMDDKEKAEFTQKYNDLIAQQYRGEISDEDFKNEWAKIQEIAKYHPIAVGKLKTADQIIKDNAALNVTDRITDKKTSKKDAEEAVNFFNNHPELIDILRKYPATKYSESNKESYKFWANKENLTKYGFKSTKDVNKALDYLLTLQKNPKLDELVIKAKEQ